MDNMGKAPFQQKLVEETLISFWSGGHGPLPFPVLSARFQCLLETFGVRWHLLLSWSVQVESIPVHHCPLSSIVPKHAKTFLSPWLLTKVPLELKH